MRRFLPILAGTLCIFITTADNAFAQWEGSASAGLIYSSGNTNTSALTGRMDIQRTSGVWTNQFIGELHQAETEGLETADRLLLGYKLSRDIDKRRYAWGSFKYDTDPFADIDERKTATFGFGYRVLTGPIHVLKIEVGAGYRITNFAVGNIVTEDTPVSLGMAYTGQLNENVKLTQGLSAEYGNENILYTSTTDLNIKMTARWSLSLIHAVRHNSKISGALGRMTDRLTTANLVYSF